MIREGHFREDKKNEDGSQSGTLWFGLLKRDFELFNKNQLVSFLFVSPLRKSLHPAN
jgi:hypothetical protein